MIDKNTDFDKLLDSAFAKDRAKLPQYSAQPDPSLVAQLRKGASIPGGGGTSMAAGGTSFFSGIAFRMLIALFGATAIGITSYFLFFANDKQAPLPNSGTVTSITDSVKKEKTDSAAVILSSQKTKNSGSPITEPKVISGTTSAQDSQKTFNANDLLTPARKEINKDEVTLPIK